MLKKICGLFLGLVVLTGSACVTPTHASSASGVVLVQVQAASPSSAKDEMVSIYNNSPNEVDVTNWCFKNKSTILFACLTPENSQLAYYLPAYSIAVVATDSFLAAHTLAPEMVSKVFVVTNQSSGSMVNSSDTVSIVDASGQVIDSVSWSSAIPSGKVMIRTKAGSDPRIYETLEPTLAWSTGALTQVPPNQLELRTLAGAEDPEDPEIPPDSPSDNPDSLTPETNPVTPLVHPSITELLPDAVGSDSGSEFIELYNPTMFPIDLSDYKLRVGPNLEKSYTFPINSVVPALEYVAFTNAQINFTLVNTSSKVQLEYKGVLAGDPVVYTTTAEGQSWSLIDDEWQYSLAVTPGAPNQRIEPLPGSNESAAEAPVLLKPCAANQYRSPETNRCRLLATSTVSSLQPCKVGQVRSSETNRCRNVETANSTQAACKAGQERNSETNRCRNIVKMTSANYAVKGISTEATSTNWYMWLGIGGVIALILGYAIWEWREELRNIWTMLQQKVARIKR